MANDQNSVVVRVEGLWKQYGFPLIPKIKKMANRMRPGGGARDDGTPWALKDISFEVKKGETLGIIGRNGAGKSTLLKVLAGVTPPSRGNISVKGTIFPMIELNAGIHPELTGIENVRLLGAVMGISKKKIESKMEQIEDFCELGEWFRRPVRKYSSGMLARLGFGVAMNVDSDIILIDEVLGVGDIAFMRKCYARIEELYMSGSTILFVSHNLHQIARVCKETILLEEGDTVFSGTTEEGIHEYEKLARKWRKKRRGTNLPLPEGATNVGDVFYDFGEISLVHAEMRVKGKTVNEIQSGDSPEIFLKFQIHSNLDKINISVIIEGIRGEPIVWHRLILYDLDIGEYMITQKINKLWLSPGEFDIRVSVDVGEILRRSLHVRSAISFHIEGVGYYLGYFHPPCTWDWQKIE